MKSLPDLLRRALPKPILFALYGALGAFLGALLLGEALWVLLRPPVAKPVEIPPLQLAASGSVSVYQEGTNRLPVKLARHKWAGAVEVRATGPGGVTAPAVLIPADGTEAELEVRVGADTLPGLQQLTVRAGGEGEGGPSAETIAELKVLELPPALRLAASPRVQVQQNNENRFTVKVRRERFAGPVEVEAADLPAGVGIEPATIPADREEIDLKVRAGAEAPVGERNIQVRVRGPEGKLTAGVPIQVSVTPAPQVDVMFVLDVTGSMDPEIAGVKAGIVGFVRDLQAKKLDARVGLVYFRDRLVPSDPEQNTLKFEDNQPFTKNAALFSEKVGELKASGGGDPPESVLDALAFASRQPFRKNASRVLLLISDDEPHKVDKEVKSITEANEILRKAEIDQLHMVIRVGRFKRVYSELQGTIKGQFFDLDKVSRGKTSLAEALPAEVARVITSEVPRNLPPRSMPAPEPTSAAREVPPVAEKPTLQGVQSAESFAADESTPWRLLLAISIQMAVIAGFLSLALVSGQHYYLRQGWPDGATSTRALVGGLAAGLVGGLAGQLLFQFTSVPGAESLARVLGWSILGGLVGFGLAFFVPNLKASRGLLGGVAGGLAGAFGFLGVVRLLQGDMTGRLLGALLLGLAVGLMVAWAEQVFRKVWLEVRYSEREAIQVTLGPEPIKIGSDRRACTVFARGAAPVALRYWIRDGKVQCEDVALKKTSEVVPDQPQPLGSLTLTVRSATTTAPPAPAPRPAAPLPIPVPPPRPAAPAGQPVAVTPPRPVASVPGGKVCPKCQTRPSQPGRRFCIVCDEGD
jgi:Mg-chelatase subunit ChlD